MRHRGVWLQLHVGAAPARMLGIPAQSSRLPNSAVSGESKPVDAQQIVDAIGGAELDTVYFDAKFPAKQGEGR